MGLLRLHRHLLRELLANAMVVLVVILSLFFMVALAFILGASRTAGLPFSVVAQHTAYEAIETLWLTLPLTLMTAALFTYGRFRADGEERACRVAGVGPWPMLLPAVLAGSIGGAALAWLGAGAMPGANFLGRVEIEQDVFRNLESLLTRSERSIREKRWSARWEGLQRTEGGYRLDRFSLARLDDRRAVTESIFARSARPSFDDRRGTLNLELEDVTIRKGDQEPTRIERIRYAFELDAIGGAYRDKRTQDMSYQELLTTHRRGLAAAERARADGDLELEGKRLRHARRAAAMLHKRASSGVSALLQTLIGAIVGLRFGTRNRALVFLGAFLAVGLLHFPLSALGEALVHSGTWPAFPGRWLGEIALSLLLGVLSFGMARR